MGLSEKMDDSTVEAESKKKWVVAGISVRSPLKPILIKAVEDKEVVEEFPTTPTAEETRIPMKCPAAPRKPKAISRCEFEGFRDFFIPPDLDSVFIQKA